MTTSDHAVILEDIIINHANLDDIHNVHDIYERVNDFLGGRLNDVIFDDDYVKRLLIRLMLNDETHDPSKDYM